MKCLAVILLLTLSAVAAKRLPDIYWNSTNYIFDISNTDHVMAVSIGDHVTIRCPLSREGQDYEYSKLFVVPESDYTNCRLSPASSQPLGVCLSPTRRSSMNIVFRPFSPTPGQIEFLPGETYYVIATSTGAKSGVDNQEGGLCATKNMRLKFEVQPDALSAIPPNPVYNPKFAARTLDKSRSSSSSAGIAADSTPVMYIITDANGDDVEMDDDSATSHCALVIILVALIAQFW